MPTSKSTGDAGERAARRYLEEKGYTVVAAQWRCKGGEIDLIARDGAVFVFVEVKTRHGGQSGDALAAITPAKRQRLIAAAYEYIAQTGLDDPAWRIDALAVTLDREGFARITYLEDALDW